MSMIKSIKSSDFGERALDNLFSIDADTFDIRKLYAVPFIRNAVRVIANSVQGIPFSVYQVSGNTAIWNGEGVAPDELMGSLRESLWYASASMELHGAAYFGVNKKIGKPVSLAYFDPTTISDIRSVQSGKKEGYSWQRQVNSVIKTVYSWDMLHVFELDPFVEIGEGRSSASSALLSGKASHALSRFAENYLSNGAVRATIFEMPTGTTRAQGEQFTAWYKRLFTGKRSGSVGAYPSGHVAAHTIGDGIGDVSSLELDKSLAIQVASAFQVPLSVVLGDSSNYATAEVEWEQFYVAKILPAAQRIIDAINAQVLSEMGYVIYLEPDRLPTFRRRQLSELGQVVSAVGGAFLTTDEARAMFNLDPLGGGRNVPFPEGL